MKGGTGKEFVRDVRRLWLFAAALLVAGGVTIQCRYEAAIAQARASTESFYRQTSANEQIIAESAALRPAAASALNDLRRISHETSLSLSTAALIATLDSCARTYRTQVVAIDPDPVPARLPMGSPRVEPPKALNTTGLTIKAHGRFADLLRFLEDLSQHRTPIGIDQVELALSPGADAAGAEPQLDATIHATLYRLTMPSLEVPVDTAS